MLMVTPAGLRRLAYQARRRGPRPLGLYRVSGASMEPTFTHGDVLVGRRWGAPRPGQVVVVDYGRPLVKRLVSVEPNGRLWLEGDNREASDDSRSFGAVPPAALVAVIIAKIASGR